MEERNAVRPSIDAVKAAFGSSVRPVAIFDPALEEFLRVARGIFVNGGVELAAFSLEENAALDWFIERGRFTEIDFFERLLNSAAFREALPHIAPQKELKSLSWEPVSSYTFDGELARSLMRGGAYRQFVGSGNQAKRLGAAVSEALFGGRYDDAVFYVSNSVWSDWFFDVAWDATWMGVDRGKRRIWALCWTDTD